jgi:hypothetical protein
MAGRKALPITTVLLILALALATVGVGYGLWSKVLTIEGVVYTGEVNAALSIEEIDEGDAALVADNGIDEDNEIEDKDIGECFVALIDQSPPDLDNKGPQLMRIAIENAYPSFSCFVNFNVQNLGTIPIKVDQPILLPYNDEALTVDFLTGNVGTEGCYYDEVNGSAVPPVYVHPQLEPDEMTFCTIWVHVEQEAEQGETYFLTTKIVAHQWNEYSVWPHVPLYP